MSNNKNSRSKVFSHLQSYPIIHDSLEYCTTHPYGAKSLSLLQTTYQHFIAPLNPYLQIPYSYLSLYFTRADEIGVICLSKVDNKFPIIKEDTSKLKEKVQLYIFLPLNLADRGKEYAWATWEEEYKEMRGEDGLVKSAKALLNTELKIAHDGYTLVQEYLNKEKHYVREKAD
ncbi:hypothetical protein B0J11DRAFT_498661 [Dendryphion nanum]|uniref:Uncharacterized protein n=1 Tax=Dendryphion nanum TaxID=256645 RepID=A0A9P9I9C6_9PLEO|nr:hypothetical protein B0J11DRAFT_498661 [Dendryphion nanum]